MHCVHVHLEQGMHPMFSVCQAAAHPKLNQGNLTLFLTSIVVVIDVW